MENSTSTGSFFETTEAPFLVYTSYSMRQLVAGIGSTAAVVGLIGNALVIVAVGLSKKLRTVTNVFIVNLSISDFISCVFIPWEAVAVLGEDGWPLPHAQWLCVITGVFIVMSTGCSVTSLALIALNRWVRITKSPAIGHRIYTRRNITLMLVFSWLMPLCVTLIPPLTGFGEFGYEPRYSSCSWVRANPNSFNHTVIVGAFYTPVQLIIIAFCYGSIFRFVIKTSRRMAQHEVNSVSGPVSGFDSTMRKNLWKRQVQVTKNLVYVVAAFFTCLFLLILSFMPLGYEWSIRMTPFVLAIVYCNCITDPIIYATSHPDFKEIFGYMIRCRWRDIPQTSASSRLHKW